MTTPPAWKNESDFGKRVRMLREDRGLSQRKLAPFGVKQPYLTSLEVGAIKSPSPEMVENIAKGLGVTVDDLLEGTNLAARYRAAQFPHKAFCTNNDCPKLSLNRLSTGMIIPYRFSIERVQASGSKSYEAKFCPYCGKKLISACPKCKEPILIDDPQQIHCVHCGKQLFEPITEEHMRAKGFR
jgi:transcriptional regulator with XRE-family HTH domain